MYIVLKVSRALMKCMEIDLLTCVQNCMHIHYSLARISWCYGSSVTVGQMLPHYVSYVLPFCCLLVV